MQRPSSLGDACLSIYSHGAPLRGSVHGAGSDAEAISAAHWRGMQALAVSSRIVDAYFCCTSLSARMHSQLLARLRWLTASDTEEASTTCHALHAHMYAGMHACTHARMHRVLRLRGGHKVERFS